MASYKNTQNSSKADDKNLPPLILPQGPIDQWKEDELIECSEKLAKRSKRVKTNQVRNFFSAVLRIKTDFAVSEKDEDGHLNKDVHLALLMLKPKLAYAAGRNKEDMKDFAESMMKVVEATLKAGDKKEGLKRFFLFVESVVAYHKYFDEKDN